MEKGEREREKQLNRISPSFAPSFFFFFFFNKEIKIYWRTHFRLELLFFYMSCDMDKFCLLLDEKNMTNKDHYKNVIRLSQKLKYQISQLKMKSHHPKTTMQLEKPIQCKVNSPVSLCMSMSLYLYLFNIQPIIIQILLVIVRIYLYYFKNHLQKLWWHITIIRQPWQMYITAVNIIEYITALLLFTISIFIFL